jgi:acetyltransferase-like isoleucine patch superfamily enzyme
VNDQGRSTSGSARRTLWETLTEALSYLRGWLTTFRFDRRALVSSHGPTRIVKKNGRIEVGDRTRLWPHVKLSVVGPVGGPPAELIIGHHSSIGDYTQIHSGRSVKIGNYVLVSWNVNILGAYYHGTGGEEEQPGDVIIEDHVWIGCGVIILKGVTIGRGSVIAAGAVVTASVPPYSLAAGNPARVIKETKSWNGR